MHPPRPARHAGGNAAVCSRVSPSAPRESPILPFPVPCASAFVRLQHPAIHDESQERRSSIHARPSPPETAAASIGSRTASRSGEPRCRSLFPLLSPQSASTLIMQVLANSPDSHSSCDFSDNEMRSLQLPGSAQCGPHPVPSKGLPCCSVRLWRQGGPLRIPVPGASGAVYPFVLHAARASARFPDASVNWRACCWRQPVRSLTVYHHSAWAVRSVIRRCPVHAAEPGANPSPATDQFQGHPPLRRRGTGRG